MLGRGIVADPGLALAIGRPGEARLAWSALLPLVHEFWELIKAHVEPRHRAGRLKQWLNFLRRRYPEAEAAYAAVRTVNDPAEVSRRLFERARVPLDQDWKPSSTLTTLMPTSATA
jgi:tRNA-dihydrouridine synthase C